MVNDKIILQDSIITKFLSWEGRIYFMTEPNYLDIELNNKVTSLLASLVVGNERSPGDHSQQRLHLIFNSNKTGHSPPW